MDQGRSQDQATFLLRDSRRERRVDRVVAARPSPPMTLPVLWHFTFSHFNEKVRWALDFKGIPHVRRALYPGLHIPRLTWMTGQAKAPVLVLGGKAIADSTRIIAALERHRPDPSLYPSEASARQRSLLLEDFVDEDLGDHLRAYVFYHLLRHADYANTLITRGFGAPGRLIHRLFFPVFRLAYRIRFEINADRADLGRAKILAALDRIEAELQPSGYLVGEGFTVADLSAAALLSPFVLPPELPYAWPGRLPGAAGAFCESLAARPALQWVAEMYRRHRPRSAEVAA